MKLGKRIKLLRIEHEMTLKDLSEATGIDLSYLSKIERQKVPIKDNFIELIAKALELTPEKKDELYDLASSENCSYPLDTKDDLKDRAAIPLLLRTIVDRKLTDTQIIEVINQINTKS